MVSVSHLILTFAILQNKFQLKTKTKINHINDNHIEFEVSLHFLGIWPTVCRTTPILRLTGESNCKWQNFNSKIADIKVYCSLHKLYNEREHFCLQSKVLDNFLGIIEPRGCKQTMFPRSQGFEIFYCLHKNKTVQPNWWSGVFVLSLQFLHSVLPWIEPINHFVKKHWKYHNMANWFCWSVCSLWTQM